MLDDVRPLLLAKKVNDLTRRLSDKKNPKQLIGGEMELGLLWGIKQVAHLQVDPAIPNSTRVPEAYSQDFFDLPSYIEVTTVSDGKLSGEEHMQRAAQKIVEFANSYRLKCGNYLFFSFAERNYWEGSDFFREHHIEADFDLTDSMKSDIRNWVNAPEFATTPLSLQSQDISVTIVSKKYRQKPGFNFFSPLPSLAYHVEDNPLFETLEAKRRQLAGVPAPALKVIFVADGGSRLLRHLTQRDTLRQYKSGEQIINHFLQKSDVDLVSVFSPERKWPLQPHIDSLNWKVTALPGAAKRIHTFSNLEKLTQALPKPRFEGYQARSIQKQSGSSPSARGWYLGTWIGSGKEKITVKISARLLQELMAGKITPQQFQHAAFSDENPFKRWLDDGYVISGTRLESAGMDEDDDRVVFEFQRDPAAADFI